MRLHFSRSLKVCAFFKGVGEAERQQVEATCTWTAFDTGQAIIDHMDRGSDVYILAEGRARVVIYSRHGKVVAFRDLNAGDIFGELAAIDGRHRSASVEAVEPAVVARLDSAAFWSLMSREPDFMRAIVRHLAAQVRELTGRVYEFSTLAVKNRIQAELFRLARDGMEVHGTPRIRPLPTHSQIASRVSTTREAVAREMSYLAKVGVLKRTSRYLEVARMDVLEQMIHNAKGE